MEKRDISIGDVYKLLGIMRKEIKQEYVSKSEFLPVKMIVYGVVSLTLTGVMTALVSQVVKAYGN